MPQPQLDIVASRGFIGWLRDENVSLSLTTYQVGKVFFIGHTDAGLSIFERTLDRCMGLATHASTLWLGSRYQIWRFENALEPGQTHDGYDRLFVPQIGYTTGDVDAHDIAVEDDGRVVFVATLFGCLATVSPTHSFAPLWRPPWLTKLVPEDRCHLNGLATENGQCAYVSSVSRSDVADAWRDQRRDGGVIVDVRTNDVVAEGLCMPHSPRIHEGRLWVLEAGTGRLGFVDRAAGTFEEVAFCPGFLRGLAFVGKYALVGTSKARRDHALRGLPLGTTLEAKRAEPRCAIHVVDTTSGAIVHWLRLEGIVEELYDVVALPGSKRPMAIGFRTDEIHRMIRVADPAAL